MKIEYVTLKLSTQEFENKLQGVDGDPGSSLTSAFRFTF